MRVRGLVIDEPSHRAELDGARSIHAGGIPAARHAGLRAGRVFSRDGSCSVSTKTIGGHRPHGRLARQNPAPQARGVSSGHDRCAPSTASVTSWSCDDQKTFHFSDFRVLVAAGGYSCTANSGRRRADAQAAPGGRRTGRRVYTGSLPLREQGEIDVIMNGSRTASAAHRDVRSRVDGELMRVLFNEGQIVKQQLLAEMIAQLPGSAAQAEGQLRATCSLENALDLERYQALYAQDSIAKQQSTPGIARAAVRGGCRSIAARSTMRGCSSLTRASPPVSGRVGLRSSIRQHVRSCDATAVVSRSCNGSRGLHCAEEASRRAQAHAVGRDDSVEAGTASRRRSSPMEASLGRHQVILHAR